MTFRKIGVKLLISYVIILTVEVLILGFFFSKAAKHFLYNEKKRELLHKGGQIGSTIIGLFNSKLQPATAGKILSLTDTSLEAKIMVLNSKGEIIAATPGLHHMGLGLVEFDYKRVLAGQNVFRQGKNPHLGFDIIFVGTPVRRHNGVVVGGVFLFAPLSAPDFILSGLRKLGLIVALIGLFCSILLAVFLSRTITLPLINLKNAATGMAKGDFNIRVAEPNDEIGELGKAFNSMAESLGHNVAALKREKIKIERMLADMSEGVLTVDAANKILFMNSKAGELLKMDHEGDWLRQKNLFPLKKLAASVMQTGAADSAELMMADKTWVLGHASPLGDSENFWGTIIVLQDISELRRVENMRKQLITDLSHELRTPLTLIRGRTEALLDKVIDDEATKEEYLRGIHAETIRLGNMVRDLLEMARLENDPHLLRPEVFCLKKLANAIVRQYTQLSKVKGIHLEMEEIILNDTAPVLADIGQIGQVLRNFLDNAFRYAKTQIIVRLKVDESMVALEVEDDGPGIPAAEQSLVWERFYKVNKARTGGENGMGLGLAIAKEIITSSGGRIWLTSTKGQGSIFGFMLPKIANV
jgi:two-component system sensor histidine kinase ResE